MKSLLFIMQLYLKKLLAWHAIRKLSIQLLQKYRKSSKISITCGNMARMLTTDRKSKNDDKKPIKGWNDYYDSECHGWQFHTLLFSFCFRNKLKDNQNNRWTRFNLVGRCVKRCYNNLQSLSRSK